MRKNIFITVMFLAFSLTVAAIPAKKGTTRTIKMTDGTEVTVRLCGDEYGHWWETQDGQRVSIDEKDNVSVLDASQSASLVESATARRSARNAVRANRMAKARKAWGNTTFTGQKKGLVILVNYTDKQMKATSTQEEFNNMFNEEGYSNNNHIGSVHDYFLDQSYGQFDLEFDVVGPVTVSKNMAYYGKNDSDGNDMYAGTMVAEACKLANDSCDVNFADYDWDGDGEVDQVFLIYAGYGENAGASANAIWPHEYELSSACYYGDGDGAIKLDGVTIDTYAVSCELSGTSGSKIDGIGTACHEFSHCLGYPDFYDIDYSGGWGMAGWDVMDTGSYSGPTCNGEIPTGYTSYERMYAGWLDPKELTLGMTVDSLKSLGDEPDAYIVYNDNNKNEYYLLENRKSERWFKYVEDYTGINGLLIIHVDYNKSSWDQNTPNDTKSHQRMTIIPASNKFPTYTSKAEYQNQLYPTSSNTELTNTSTPSASLFNKNTDGKKLMNKPITDIKKSSDGIISFKCIEEKVIEPDTTQTDSTQTDYIFYESFDKCEGTGGNDDLWMGTIANTTFIPDNDGWESAKAFGANQCAKFGSSSASGKAITPSFALDGEATLTFKAACWDSTKDDVTLIIQVDDDDVATFDMARGKWTNYAVDIIGTGSTYVTFLAANRFFLDEVLVKKSSELDNIVNVSDIKADGIIYDLSGRRLNAMPQKGVFIINGRKYIK